MSGWKRVIATILIFCGIGISSIVFEEFFHLVAIEALGGQGRIERHEIISREEVILPFIAVNHSYSQIHHEWLVPVSGGLGTALFLLIFFWIWGFTSKSSHYAHIEFAAFTWAMIHIVNIPFDVGLWYGGPWILISYALIFPAAVIIVWLYIKKLLVWLYFNE